MMLDSPQMERLEQLFAELKELRPGLQSLSEEMLDPVLEFSTLIEQFINHVNSLMEQSGSLLGLTTNQVQWEGRFQDVARSLDEPLRFLAGVSTRIQESLHTVRHTTPPPITPAVIPLLETQAAHQQKLASEGNELLEDTRTQLGARLDACRSGESELAEARKVVDDSVGELIVGLQSHDIMTQCMEHTLQVLDSIEASAVERAGEQQWVARIGVSARLVASLLERVREELRQAESRLRYAIEPVECLLSSPAILNNLNEATLAVDEMVLQLLGLTKNVQDLVTRSAQLIRDSSKRLAPPAAPVPGLDFESILDCAVSHQRRLEHSSGQTGQALESVISETRKHIEAAAQILRQARKLALRMAACVESFQSFGHRLAQTEAVLGEIEAIATALVGEEELAGYRHEFDWLLGRYSMAAERIAHNEAVGMAGVGVDQAVDNGDALLF